MRTSGSNQRRMLEYQRMASRISPNSEMPLNLLRAFLVGGLICAIGQGLSELAEHFLRLDKDDAAMFTSVVLIFLGSTLTGLGVYDRIGRFAGAGSIVPITGFANSIVAPAMEYKREGYVLGVGAKLFALAGPVLVYGVSASIVVGVIAFLFGYKG